MRRSGIVLVKWLALSCALMIIGSTAAQAQRRAGGSSELLARARAVEPLMRDAARRHGVDPRVLWTIAYLETRFPSNQISPKGARGMMQFMPATAATYGLTNPFDAAASIDAAARYVRFLAARFDNRFDLILAGYNSGEGTVEAYLRGIAIRQPDGRIINPRRLQTGGIPPYQETMNYVANGLVIARQVHAANIFNATEFVACRYPVAQPNAAPAAITTIARTSENAGENSNNDVPPAPSSVYASTLAAVSSPAPSATSSETRPQQNNSSNVSQIVITEQPRSSYVVAREQR
ncbi:hypothetical protein BH18ACI2_BH18ACI2_21880 [soil metagenome]